MSALIRTSQSPAADASDNSLAADASDGSLAADASDGSSCGLGNSMLDNSISAVSPSPPIDCQPRRIDGPSTTDPITRTRSGTEAAVGCPGGPPDPVSGASSGSLHPVIAVIAATAMQPKASRR